MKHQSQLSMCRMLYSSIFLVSLIYIPNAMADNVSLLISGIIDEPVNSSVLVQRNDTEELFRTLGDACRVNLDIISSVRYKGMTSAERSAALINLQRCMEINGANPSAIKVIEDAVIAENNIAKFQSLNWGIGFGYSQAREKIIDEAIVVNGLIKSKVDRTDKVRLILESHIFLSCHNVNSVTKMGCGPFLAISSGDYKTLSGVGIGWMWGWKSMDPKRSDSFAIGLGFMADETVKTLADGFEEGRALPSGETVIRYVKKSSCSSLIFVSHSF